MVISFLVFFLFFSTLLIFGFSSHALTIRLQPGLRFEVFDFCDGFFDFLCFVVLSFELVVFEGIGGGLVGAVVDRNITGVLKLDNYI